MADIPAIKMATWGSGWFPGASWSWLAWKAPMTARRTAPFWPPNGCFSGENFPCEEHCAMNVPKRWIERPENWNMIRKGTILIAEEVGDKNGRGHFPCWFSFRRTLLFSVFEACYLLYIILNLFGDQVNRVLRNQLIVGCTPNFVVDWALGRNLWQTG